MGSTRFTKRHAASALIVVAAIAAGARRGAADAPPGRFTVTAGGTPTGTVEDTQTGLVWQQAVTMTSGTTADGGVGQVPVAYTLSDATSFCTTNAGGLPGTGWRLPSMTELQTIVDDSRTNPAVDPTAFPGTPIALFWTSSPYAPQAGYTWCIDFDAGYTFLCATTGGSPTTAPLRCVR